MQPKDNTQEQSSHVPMFAPKANIKENRYSNHLFVNAENTVRLVESAWLFNFIVSHLKRPYSNTRSRSNPFYEKEYILEHTVADVDFNAVKSSYSRVTYTKLFNELKEHKAILKVNDNVRCHKYYVNPDYAHTLERYVKVGESQCDIYYDNYNYLWI